MDGAGHAGSFEREVKLRLDDPVRLRARLRELGAERVEGPAREHNVLFDTGDGRLRASGSVLRLRRYAGRWILTFKGPARYRGDVKEREVWRLAQARVFLDRTALGWFVEIEGDGPVPEATVRWLGLDPAAAVRGSYLSLWEAHRRERPDLGLPPDMLLPP